MSRIVSSNDGQLEATSASSYTGSNRSKSHINTRLQKEYQARVRAEARLLQLQTAFTVLARRTEHEAKERYAAEHAELLALEAAELRIAACKAARLEAERKLEAEQVAEQLLRSQAEADRISWQMQEQTNVLLRKAEQKAQERMATEVMARKAAAFKLETERELAVIAEKRASEVLKSAREVELRHRAEKISLAGVSEKHSNQHHGLLMSGLQIDNETPEIATAAIQIFNGDAMQARCDRGDTKMPAKNQVEAGS